MTGPGAAAPSGAQPAEPADGRTFGPDFLTQLFRHPLDPAYADAARRRAEHGPRTGWRRHTVRAVSLVVTTAVGFLLIVAYRQTVADEPARTQARQALVGQVQQRQAQTDDMQRRAEALRAEVAQLRDAALTGTAAARLRDLEASTGLARVRGPGIVVRLADGAAPADAVTGNKPNLARVFDRDLQDLANALWAVGAEALAINGQRLTATSTIRRAGEAILVDLRPVIGPYEVTAIGPDDLESRFLQTPSARLFRRLVSDVGMSFEVRRADELTLPAAAAPNLRFARPSVSPSPSVSGPPVTPAPSGSSVGGSTPGSARPARSPSEGGR